MHYHQEAHNASDDIDMSKNFFAFWYLTDALKHLTPDVQKSHVC